MRFLFMAMLTVSSDAQGNIYTLYEESTSVAGYSACSVAVLSYRTTTFGLLFLLQLELNTNANREVRVSQYRDHIHLGQLPLAPIDWSTLFLSGLTGTVKLGYGTNTQIKLSQYNCQ